MSSTFTSGNIKVMNTSMHNDTEIIYNIPEYITICIIMIMALVVRYSSPLVNNMF